MRVLWTMDYEKWSRLSMSDKIRRFDKVRKVREDRVYWSLSEAMDIGASILGAQT